MPSIVKNDSWWMADPHRKAYTTQALLRPTLPVFWAYNPAYAHVQNEHVWQTAWAEIMQNGTKPQDTADKDRGDFREISDRSKLKVPLPVRHGAENGEQVAPRPTGGA